MRAENAISVVDGNAAAGILSEVFAGDVTSAIALCAGCGATAVLAEAIVELDEAAAIVRCRNCTHTLVTVLHDAAQTRIVVGTLRELEISRDEARAGA